MGFQTGDTKREKEMEKMVERGRDIEVERESSDLLFSALNIL